jgi:hypothetical protein
MGAPTITNESNEKQRIQTMSAAAVVTMGEAPLNEVTLVIATEATNGPINAVVNEADPAREGVPMTTDVGVDVPTRLSRHPMRQLRPRRNQAATMKPTRNLRFLHFQRIKELSSLRSL